MQGLIIGGGSPPTACFELDAGLSASYSGTGQTFANLVAAPSDGETQTTYDFWLGDGSSGDDNDPVFTGTPNANTAAEYFKMLSSGGAPALFTGKNSTTFLKSLWQNNAVFSVYSFLRTPAGGNTATLFQSSTSGNVKMSVELRYLTASTFSINLVLGNDSGTSIVASGGIVNQNADVFVAISYTESTGAGLFCVGSTITEFTASYTSPSSVTATATATIGTYGGGSLSNPMKLWRAGVYNVALTRSQLKVIYARYKFKIGQ